MAENDTPSIPPVAAEQPVVEEKIEDDETKEQEHECRTCQMDAIMPAYAAAITACELMDDEKAKEKCKEVVEMINPENIKDGVKVMKEIVRLPEGIKAIDKHVRGFNLVTDIAVIEVVEEMMANHEEVPPDLKAIFKDRTAKRPI